MKLTIVGILIMWLLLMYFVALRAMKEEYARGLADSKKSRLSEEERKQIEEQHKDDLAWRKAHPRRVTVWDEYIGKFSVTWDGETIKCEAVK